MATIVKIDIKNDLGVTLADFNKEAHLGTFEVPVWAQDLYAGKTDEEIFDDFAAAIYESFTPIIGEALAFIYTANLPYFQSDKIVGNVRLAMFQEIFNWMLNVPMEVKNNVNFSAQAGFSFSLSIQPWLINYDEFTIKTRTYIQETGLIGVCIEDLAGIELWVKPTFASGEELRLVSIHQDKQYTGKDAELIQKGYVDEEIRNSVANSHKIIAGEYVVADKVNAQEFYNIYISGADQTLTNGRVFNNGNASPGEIVFLIPSNPGSNFIAEEIIVGANKELITLSNENVIDGRIAANEADIAANKLVAEAAAKATDLKSEETARVIGDDNLEKLIKDNNDILTTYGTQITDNSDQVYSANQRIYVLETAQELDDAIWQGRDHGSLSMDISRWKDQNGNDFDFSDGKNIELVFEDPATHTESGEIMRIGNTNDVRWAMGAHPFSGKIDSTGTLTVTPEATTDMPSVNLVRIVQSGVVPSVIPYYTKTESDTKFATIVNLAAVKTKTDTAQQKIDVGIKDPATNVVITAINNLYDRSQNNEVDFDELNSGSFDIKGDGTIVVKMFNDDGSLTDSFKTLIGVRTDAEIDALIDAKLSTAMDVTFDDSSTGAFKVGK